MIKTICFFTCVTLILTCLQQPLQAKCHAPERGPPGPQGPAGTLVSSYASAASDVQPIIATFANFPINFTNNLVPPVGIVHPYQSDDSKFEIVDSGIYQIAWTVPFEWDVTLEDTVELYIKTLVLNKMTRNGMPKGAMA